MGKRWLVRVTAIALLGGAFAGAWFVRRSDHAASVRAQSDRVALLEAASAEREARLQAASAANHADAERLGARLAEAERELSESRRAVEDAGTRMAQVEKERKDVQLARDAAQAEVLAANARLEKAYKDIAEVEQQLVDVSSAKNGIEAKLARVEKECLEAVRVRETAQAEMLAANDRLEKACKDIAEMEKQLVDVSRAKNLIESQLAEAEAELDRLLPDRHPSKPVKIDGVVLGVSDKVNLILISVGGSDKVKHGMNFTVYRGSTYVSKLVVDKVEDGWAACRELTDFRKDTIQQGDSVSTKELDEPESPEKRK